MSYSIDDFRKQAKRYADEFDLEGLVNSIDFSKVDTKKLKKIDFSKGLESARHQLDQLPKVRVTTEPEHSAESGFLGGMLLGVVLGAIIALLFAPKTGEDTRELVINTVDDIKQKVTGETDQMMDDLVETVDVASDDVEEALSDEPAIERTFG